MGPIIFAQKFLYTKLVRYHEVILWGFEAKIVFGAKPGLEIRLFKKNSRRKKLKTQGKNSITQEQNSRIRYNFNSIPSTKAKNYLQRYFFQLKSWDIT